jgi:hydrogenase nickel incorporation protein HypA/HybF
MHEMGIANSIMDAVRTEMLRYPDSRAERVGVRIGELAAVDPESLQFCFEALTRETDLDGLELEIEYCPRRHRCRECQQEYMVRDYDLACPACESTLSDCIGGDELELGYLEVEEYEPSAAGTQST